MSRGVLVILCLGAGTAAPPLANATPTHFPATDHCYECNALEVCWAAALDMARWAVFVDSSGTTWRGHLATVTSSDEDDFLTTTFGPAGWIAGADPDADDAWIWHAGDELGECFWDSGLTVTYANWQPGAPSTDPARRCLLKRDASGGGTWEDRTMPEPHGFYVEYVRDTTSAISSTSWGAVKHLFR